MVEIIVFKANNRVQTCGSVIQNLKTLASPIEYRTTQVDSIQTPLLSPQDRIFN